MTKEITRLSVNMNEPTSTALRAVMAAEGVTATEAVRRAVSIMKFLQDQRLKGARVFYQLPDGETREVVFL